MELFIIGWRTAFILLFKRFLLTAFLTTFFSKIIISDFLDLPEIFLTTKWGIVYKLGRKSLSFFLFFAAQNRPAGSGSFSS